MPILAVLDESTHGGLDDPLKTLYVQNTEDKKFYLDIAPDEAAKVAFNLQKQFEAKKTDLSRVHGEKSAMATKLKPFEDLGKTVEEIKAALESNQPPEVTKLLEKFETDKQALQKSFEEPLNAAKTRAEKLEGQVQTLLSTTAISKLRSDFDLNETADYVLRDYIKVIPKEEGSDEYAVKVFDNGSPALIAGQEMTPDQLIKSWQEAKKFPAMFNANGGGGGGATGRQTTLTPGTKQMKRDDYFKLAPAEQSKFIAEGGRPID